MGLNPQFLWTTLIAYLALISGPTRAMFGMSWHAKRNDGKPTACQASVLLQLHYEAGDGMDGNKFCLVCSVAKHFPQFKIIRPHSKWIPPQIRPSRAHLALNIMTWPQKLRSFAFLTLNLFLSRGILQDSFQSCSGLGLVKGNNKYLSQPLQALPLKGSLC